MSAPLAGDAPGDDCPAPATDSAGAGGSDPRAGSVSGRGASARPGTGRVVISSLTGEPLAWDEPEPASRGGRETPRRPVVPDRAAADAPEPGADESHDARIARDVPPHWGRGR